MSGKRFMGFLIGFKVLSNDKIISQILITTVPSIIIGILHENQQINNIFLKEYMQ